MHSVAVVSVIINIIVVVVIIIIIIPVLPRPTSIFIHRIDRDLSVVLYGCETWSLTLREQHRLRVF